MFVNGDSAAMNMSWGRPPKFPPRVSCHPANTESLILPLQSFIPCFAPAQT